MSKKKSIDSQPAKRRNQVIADLKKQGFRRIPETDIFINDKGETMIYPKNQPASRDRLTLNGKTIRIEKVVLWIFKGEPIRGGKIVHIDGNTANNSPENLKYRTLGTLTAAPVNVNRPDLLTAIRCFKAVEKRFKARTSDPQTRDFLKDIFPIRVKTPFQEMTEFERIFLDWCYCWECKPTTNKQISEKYGLTLLEAKNLIAAQLNRFTGAIIQDLENGKLTLFPYYKRPRKPADKTPYLPASIKKAFRELGIKPKPPRDWKKIRQSDKITLTNKRLVWVGTAIAELNRAQQTETDPERKQQIGKAIETATAEIETIIKEKLLLAKLNLL